MTEQKKLDLGRVVATPGVLEAVSRREMFAAMVRHVRGDWGTVCPDDAKANDEALEWGGRILSAYPIDPTKPAKGFGDNVFWVITEADRSATTILLPHEY